jgi:hypothetical protein
MSDAARIEFAEMFKKRTKKFVVDNIRLSNHCPKQKKLK